MGRWVTGCVGLVLSITFFFGCVSQPSRDDHPEYFDKLFKKVDSIGTQLNAEQTMAYIDSAYRAFPNPGIIDKFNRYNAIEKYWYYKKTNYSRALMYTDSMIQLVEDKKNIEKFAQLYAIALFTKGDCYYRMSLFDDAFHYYYLGQEVVNTSLKDKCSNTDFDAYIPYLLYAQEKYLMAADYFKQEFINQAKCPEYSYDRLVVLQRTLTNIGLCYYHQEMLDSAQYYFDSTLKFFDKNADKYAPYPSFVKIAKGVVFDDKAQILSRQSHYAEAEIMFKNSYDSTKSGDIPFSQNVQLGLASMYVNMGSFKKADSLLEDLKASLDTVHNEKVFFNWNKIKSDYYVKTNEPAKAYEYLHAYLSVKDSADKRAKAFASKDVNNKFENMEHRLQVEALEKENHIQSLYLLTALVFLVMFIAIILLAWYNLRRISRLNRQIQQKNRDLQISFASLEQSHSENTRITRIVAHDLKNPISAIYNLVYSLRKKEESPSKVEILELIQTSCANSITLINDLLHEKKNVKEVKKDLVDMSRLLEYCVEMMRTKAEEKHQRLLLETEKISLPLNRQKMWRVVSNIINNAIKFSPENSTIRVKFQKKNESAVLLSVQDNGIGIPVDLQDKIFTGNPENRRPGTMGEESHGLGLSIVRKIVEEHGGTILFESSVGKGTVFYVELPYAN